MRFKAFLLILWGCFLRIFQRSCFNVFFYLQTLLSSSLIFRFFKNIHGLRLTYAQADSLYAITTQVAESTKGSVCPCLQCSHSVRREQKPSLRRGSRSSHTPGIGPVRKASLRPVRSRSPPATPRRQRRAAGPPQVSASTQRKRTLGGNEHFCQAQQRGQHFARWKQ